MLVRWRGGAEGSLRVQTISQQGAPKLVVLTDVSPQLNKPHMFEEVGLK